MVSRVLVAAVLAAVVGLALVPERADADCCSIPLAQGKNNAKPMDMDSTGRKDELDPGKDNGKPSGTDGAVDLTSDAAAPESTFSGGGLGFVTEPQQQAIVAWDGQWELLMLTTNERLNVRASTPVLHVMPLPGPPNMEKDEQGNPKGIFRVDPDTFKKAKKLVLSKLPNVGGASLGVVLDAKIGAHNIFIWKLEDHEEFVSRVQSYVAGKFGPNTKALINDKIVGVVKAYQKRGFRYFAFDLVLMTDKTTSKEAIGYHFKSNAAFYPLVISTATNTGNTAVDLVVFTKNKIQKIEGVAKDDLKVVGGMSVGVSGDELTDLHPRLGELFGNAAEVRGANIQFGGKIDGFKFDFTAR